MIDCYRLDLAACAVGDWTLLDESEQARARRYRFERHRTRFIAAHAGMRRLLGARLGIAPDRVRLTATPEGKPVLADEDGRPGNPDTVRPFCWFNLTHSESVGYLALAPCRVGIDVEVIRPFPDLQPLMESCCSPQELAALAAIPAASRALGFLQVWTRKEAALKAWGDGIGAIRLTELDVGIDGQSLPGPVGATTSYPSLQLRSVVSQFEAVGIAAATDSPLEFRLHSAT